MFLNQRQKNQGCAKPNVLAALQIVLHKVCFCSCCGAGVVGKATDTQLSMGEATDGACLFGNAPLQGECTFWPVFTQQKLAKVLEAEVCRQSGRRHLGCPTASCWKRGLVQLAPGWPSVPLKSLLPALQGPPGGTAFVSSLVLPSRCVQFANSSSPCLMRPLNSPAPGVV